MLLLAIALSLTELAPRPLEPHTAELQAAPVCGDSAQFSRLRVGNLLAAARRPGMPSPLSELAGVDPAHLRLLDGEQDSNTCKSIRREVLARRATDRLTSRPWIVSIYEADGYFFAVLSRDQPRVSPSASRRVPIMIGEHGGAIIVFDRSMQRVLETTG
jgi:hypothetical protein